MPRALPGRGAHHRQPARFKVAPLLAVASEEAPEAEAEPLVACDAPVM
jgi:hypothetical protein